MNDWVKELTKDLLSSVSSKEFGILLYYAKGCAHCEALKPKVEEIAQAFPQLGFYKIELAEGYEEFIKHADKEPEVTYEAVEGSEETKAVPVLDENGQPVMTYKISVPSFYIYHTKNQSPDNPLGFCGGLDGSSAEELILVCQDLMGIIGGPQG